MSDESRRRWSRPGLIALSLGAAMLVGGATVAVAGVGRHDSARSGATNKVAHPKIVGVGHANCAVGYDTESGTNVPPDDSTADNAPAATVTFTKMCAGAVVGMFSGEVAVPSAGDFIHLDMRATCVGKGGQTQPCTIGTQVFGSPGHSFFSNGPTTFGTRASQMVWTNLPKGRWTFEVLPGGNNSANLQFRSFSVVAYTGG